MAKSKFSSYIPGLILIAVIAGGYFLIKNQKEGGETEIKESVTETPTAKPAVLVDRTLVTEKTYKEPNTYVTFNITYPQFKNASDEFNKEISQIIEEGIAWTTENGEANWKARYETKLPGEQIGQFPKEAEKFSFDVSWLPTQVNGQYISFVLVLSGYTGGAHGYENTVSFNYNVASKKEVTLKDLFPNDSNYLKTISQFSRTDLKAQFRKKLELKAGEEFPGGVIDMLDAGTTPDATNFQVFTFTPANITFYFAEYQVAPYAMGSSKVVMPRK